MCDENVITNLPLLPGYSIPEEPKERYHKINCFGFYQGFPSWKNDFYRPGDYPRDIHSMRFSEVKSESASVDPTLTYGRSKGPSIPPFRPHYVYYDGKCLRFRGYFQQPIYNSPDEQFRIRIVEVIYFLVDDTVTVVEPRVLNSGLLQGRLVRRGRIPLGTPPDCEYLHWKDLNLGIDLKIPGFTIRLVNCDEYTKEFLLSQGIEVGEPEEIPIDDYTTRRLIKSANYTKQEQQQPQDLKFQRFLRYDGQILRFRAVWDSRNIGGDLGEYGIAYFLADNTVQISEIIEHNSGKDPFPLLLKKTRLPKNWRKIPATYPLIYLEVTEDAIEEYYEPKDFIVGETIFVFGRKMLLTGCDQYTRDYYRRNLQIDQPPNFSAQPQTKPKLERSIPPYNGFGDLDDSLQNCLYIAPKPPRRNAIRQIVNANKFLRYKAKLKSTHPEDENREFVISYSLGDSTIMINELRIRNSGHIGGRFLAPMRLPKPGNCPDYPEYYSPADFVIGGIIVANDYKFLITSADLQVYRYMEDNSEKFPPEVIRSVKDHLTIEGILK